MQIHNEVIEILEIRSRHIDCILEASCKILSHYHKTFE